MTLSETLKMQSQVVQRLDESLEGAVVGGMGLKVELLSEQVQTGQSTQ